MTYPTLSFDPYLICFMTRLQFCSLIYSRHGRVTCCQHYNFVQPITRRDILDSSKLKEFADDNFKFDENGKKLSKRVENTVGKGETARYECFFQKACFPGASKGVIVWEWFKYRLYNSQQ